MTDTNTPVALDSRQNDIAGFYGKVKAHDILLRMPVAEQQRRDPQFAERYRKALDIALGKVRSESYPSDLSPFALEIGVKMRETIREMLDVAENADAEMRKALVVALGKPRTLRRRFLNWLERGW
jgi:hypothetical protein